MSNIKSQISNTINGFFKENLNEAFRLKSEELLNRLEKSNEEILSTSRTDIWAAAVINIVLDANGIFGKKHPMHMTKKDFSQNIGVSSGTIKSKSEIVKEILNIEENDQTIIVASTEEVSEVEENKVEEKVIEKVENKKEVNEKELMYQNFMNAAHKSEKFDEKVENFKNAINVALEMINQDGEVVYWEDEVTKPYMIALQDLGNLFSENQKYDDAKKVYELLLNLNPADHQGIRYKLINILIKGNERKQINDLFIKYNDDKSAIWLYSKVLYYYKNKNLFMAKDALKQAVDTNKYIALKLIKWTAFMQMSGIYINPVLFNEANFYCEESIDLWKEAKGSIDWLLKNVLKK